MSTPGTSPKIGAEATGSNFDSNLIWFNYPEGDLKIKYLDEVAGDLGKCFVRLAIFCSELARLQLEDFKKVIDNFSATLGHHPLGHDIFVELAILNNLGMTDDSVRRMSKGQVEDIFGGIMKSKARIVVTQVEGSDLYHAHTLRPHPFCECSSPVCEHGWSARMCSVALCIGGRRVGASGFDLNAFVSEMENGELGFEDSFSELTAKPEGKRQKERLSVNESVKEMGEHSQLLIASLQAQLATANARVENLSEHVFMEDPPSPPKSPERVERSSSFGSVLPDDSSSVIDRYNKRFMNPGTIFSVKERALGQQFKAPKLVVDDCLVSGFTITPTMAKRETEKVSKLRPINGLPKPFTNTRLNFLCNLHTAMHKKLNEKDGSYLDAMYRAMKEQPRLPYEDLLQQVLATSIDLSTKTWCSNAFELPYIEVGMLFTEDSVVKMFDLLQLEYKKVWFQEFKSLTIPSFHGDYKGVSTNILSSRGKGSVSVHRDSKSSSKSGRKGSRSVLGF